ncbi:MAG: hypothetical protein C4B59_07940 [Candidatus Methanogaster sp.]|uniref:Uncharacterized protein n=1 Tax=Candidatus Methanogaster sp. TaxID=3386292 RepID=A0AC61L385_9EURY|nr:MAG: hypothetical protein C4B59_07940 [ANME-2 cluster archaeon]
MGGNGMKVIMDSDSLIKLTKAKAKETVLKNIEVHIPPKVFEEVVKIPKEEGYPDAFLIEENLKRGLLAIGKSGEDQHVEEMITRLRIGYSEADVFRLYKSGSFDIISSDDRRFLKIIDALDVPYIIPSALIVYLLDKNILSRADAKMYINNLKKMISEEEYYLAIREVE